MKKSVWLFLLLVLNIYGQPIQIEKTFSKDSVTIGEWLNVDFKVILYEKNEKIDKVGNKGKIFNAEVWEDNFPADVEIKDKKIKNIENGTLFTYSIACYDTGWISIAPFKIALPPVEKDSTLIYYGTDSIRVYVKSVAPDSASSMVSNKMPVSYPFPWIKLIIIIAAILLLIVAGIYIYKKMKNKEAISEEIIIPKRPAHEIAFEKLNKIDPDKIFSPMEAKIFHFELSYVFREYLENRFIKNYLEKTTFEIKPLLKMDIINNDIYHTVIKILSASDEVKFAKKELENKYHKGIYNKIVEVVRTTMVKKVDAEKENEVVTST
ncbi:MAG: hypothetical protein KAR38_10240 [Calditrichia bacterium]|nr:hypothetical protein [Calditrichia bacterium]